MTQKEKVLTPYLQAFSGRFHDALNLASAALTETPLDEQFALPYLGIPIHFSLSGLMEAL